MQRLNDFDQLPALHLRLLNNALRLVRPGGVVVFSTCTLDRAQNDEVLRASDAMDEEKFRVLDLNCVAKATKEWFFFCDPRDLVGEDSSLGSTIVPSKGKSWGPMFISAIQKLPVS